MKPETVERLTVLNTGLLLVLVWKVFIASESSSDLKTQSAEQFAQVQPTPLEKPTGNSSPEIPPDSGGANNYEELLLQSIEPLERAYAEHGENIELPTDEQLQAAIKTNSLISEESKVVLQILKEGYEKFNMPFPRLEIPSSRVSTPTTPKQNNAPENETPPPFGEWLRGTAETLTEALKKNKESPQEIRGPMKVVLRLTC